MELTWSDKGGTMPYNFHSHVKTTLTNEIACI